MADRVSAPPASGGPAPLGGAMQRRARAGFAIGLVGTGLYVVGATVLPYAVTTDPASMRTTLVAAALHAIPQAGAGVVSAEFISLFGVAIIAGVISIYGARSASSGYLAAGLLGASSVLFLRVVEELLVSVRFPIELSWLGARAMDLGICCMFAGGVIASLSHRGIGAASFPSGGDMEEPPVGATSVRAAGRAGFVIALSGASVFVVASFLPYFRLPLSTLVRLGVSNSTQATQSRTLAQGLLGGDVLDTMQRVIQIYGTALIIGVAALEGLRASRRDRWAAGLLGAAAAWSAGVAGTLVAYDRVRLAGLWASQLAIVIALVGGTVAVRANLNRLPTETP